MKKYKLLKDLPFAKAGDIFKGKLEYGTTVLSPEDYENYKHKLNSDEFWDFDEWFEEIKEPKLYFIIDFFRKDVIQISDAGMMGWSIDNVKSLGLLFETEQEAEEHLEYLEAKEIIRQDTKGFKPNWTDEDETKYYGYWGFKCEEPDCGKVHITKEANIYFKSSEDLKESFRKHPKEWETYLTYEQ